MGEDGGYNSWHEGLFEKVTTAIMLLDYQKVRKKG
jgi:hypothetical protein